MRIKKKHEDNWIFVDGKERYHFDSLCIWLRHKEKSFDKKGRPRHFEQDHVKVLIMERHLGIYLNDYEVIYHGDLDCQNNFLQNLELMTRGENMRHHFIYSQRVMPDRFCFRCGSKTTSFKARWNKTKSHSPLWLHLSTDKIN